MKRTQLTIAMSEERKRINFKRERERESARVGREEEEKWIDECLKFYSKYIQRTELFWKVCNIRLYIQFVNSTRKKKSNKSKIRLLRAEIENKILNST